MGWLFRNLKRIDRFFYRKRLRNTSFSLISNNCIGGVISHDLGLQFRSPTVDLYFTNEDFILFCRHLRDYLRLPVVEADSGLDYPVGALKGDHGTVRIYFIITAVSRKRRQSGRKGDPGSTSITCMSSWSPRSAAKRFLSSSTNWTCPIRSSSRTAGIPGSGVHSRSTGIFTRKRRGEATC